MATVQTRIDALHAADAAAGVTNDLPIPVDLVTSSASGLDPQISPAAAHYQVARIAALRGTDAASIQALVDQYTEGRTLGFVGRAACECPEAESGAGRSVSAACDDAVASV